jgi:hypothetical protein
VYTGSIYTFLFWLSRYEPLKASVIQKSIMQLDRVVIEILDDGILAKGPRQEKLFSIKDFPFLELENIITTVVSGQPLLAKWDLSSLDEQHRFAYHDACLSTIIELVHKNERIESMMEDVQDVYFCEETFSPKIFDEAGNTYLQFVFNCIRKQISVHKDFLARYNNPRLEESLNELINQFGFQINFGNFKTSSMRDKNIIGTIAAPIKKTELFYLKNKPMFEVKLSNMLTEKKKHCASILLHELAHANFAINFNSQNLPEPDEKDSHTYWGNIVSGNEAAAESEARRLYYEHPQILEPFQEILEKAKPDSSWAVIGKYCKQISKIL